MTQRIGHVNLTASEFPINFAEFGNAVFYPDAAEQNRFNLSGTSAGRDTYGVSQAYYLKDVMPLYRGYSSVDYFRYVLPSQNLPPFDGADMYIFVDGPEANIAIVISLGFAYYLGEDGWVNAPCGAVIEDYSVCTVKGKTYLFIANNGIFSYDFDNNKFVQETVQGIEFIGSPFIGMVAVNGVLVLYSETALTYSSYLDPLDFRVTDESNQPTNSGAGTTSIIALQGSIVTIVPFGTDMIIYTTENAVSGQATGNVQFPWSFRGVTGFPGIADANNVAKNAGGDFQVALTPSGFYAVAINKCQLIWPELFQAIARGYVTELDSDNVPQMKIVGKLRSRVKFIAGRYWVISVGPTNAVSYSGAYVFDEMLQRWGRLDIEHVECYTFKPTIFVPRYTYNSLARDYETYGAIPSQYTYDDLTKTIDISSVTNLDENIGFLQVSGAAYSMRLATENSTQGNGIICFGKFKIVRNGGSCLQSILAHGIISGNISAFGHGYDGDTQRTIPKLTSLTSAKGRAFGRVSGDSISVMVSGSFKITDFSVYASDAGKINTQQRAIDKFVVVNDVQVTVLDVPVVSGGVF